MLIDLHVMSLQGIVNNLLYRLLSDKFSIIFNLHRNEQNPTYDDWWYWNW
jgi:hypothetical protein